MNQATQAFFTTRAFWLTTLINALWINASEIFRYFVFVMPMMREAFPQIDNVAPMNWFVFAIWGVWDSILVLCVTGFVWMFLERFGRGSKSALLAGTLVWAAIFVILWMGILNMNITTPNVLAIALPLSWVEMVIAAMIVNWGMLRFADS